MPTETSSSRAPDAGPADPAQSLAQPGPAGEAPDPGVSTTLGSPLDSVLDPDTLGAYGTQAPQSRGGAQDHRPDAAQGGGNPALDQPSDALKGTYGQGAKAPAPAKPVSRGRADE